MWDWERRFTRSLNKSWKLPWICHSLKTTKGAKGNSCYLRSLSLSFSSFWAWSFPACLIRIVNPSLLTPFFLSRHGSLETSQKGELQKIFQLIKFVSTKEVTGARPSHVLIALAYGIRRPTEKKRKKKKKKSYWETIYIMWKTTGTSICWSLPRT